MKANRSIVALAVAGLFAVAASAFAHGPGGGFGMGFGPGGSADPAVHSERVQWRLDELKGALNLQPAQLEAWNAYEAKVKTEAQAHAQLRQSMFDSRSDAQAFTDQRATMMKQRAQAFDEINALRKSLNATLTDEQKTTFDRYSGGPRFARDPAAGQSPGFGPGYGMRGGRGPGYGRGGCLGIS